MPDDTLYYDGQCPLCCGEINKLKRHVGDKLAIVDIHSLAEDVNRPDKQTLLKNLHLQQASGDFLIGLEANVAAWQYTRFGIFFRWLRWPLLRSVADRVYNYWAKLRYQRRYNNQVKKL
jgi:predicted DCC family thiol-disulfide oxidoreductase YuxK